MGPRQISSEDEVVSEHQMCGKEVILVDDNVASRPAVEDGAMTDRKTALALSRGEGHPISRVRIFRAPVLPPSTSDASWTLVDLSKRASTDRAVEDDKGHTHGEGPPSHVAGTWEAAKRCECG